MNIIEELAPYVKVSLGAQDEREIEKIEQTLKENNIPDQHVTYYVVPHNDIWTRDMGPIFLKSNTGKLAIVDFNFNVWGYEDASSQGSKVEERVDRIIGNLLKLPTIKTNLISEGGNREFNGKGTLMVTEAVELQRNPNMTRDEIENEFKRLFNVTKVIWLKKGLYEDDLTFMGPLPGRDGEKNVYTVITTGGHIDIYARFANPNTILLAEVSKEEAAKDPIAKVNRERIEENYQILKSATDQDGNPFNIVRIPLPDLIFDTLAPGDGVYDYIKNLKYLNGSTFPDGEEIKVVLATSYLNFLVTNGVVLGSSYWLPGRPESMKIKDAQAKQILESVFPDREIILINTENINIGGGGIHCITQQQPAL